MELRQESSLTYNRLCTKCLTMGCLRLQKTIISCMCSNKKPDNSVAFPYSYSPIFIIYSRRPPGFFLVDALKVKSWVKWILFKDAIGFLCLLLHILRQLSK
jgi:hypothetical protein